MLVTVLVPVTAAALGAAFLGERLLPQHMAGFALIACGLLVMDGRLRRPRRGLRRGDPSV